MATDLSTELEGHPDNASASVRGGMTVSWRRDPGDPSPSATGTASVATHPDVTAVVLVPREQLATHTARAVLPPHVDHVDAAHNSGRAALLVEAMTPASGPAAAGHPGLAAPRASGEPRSRRRWTSSTRSVARATRR